MAEGYGCRKRLGSWPTWDESSEAARCRFPAARVAAKARVVAVPAFEGRAMAADTGRRRRGGRSVKCVNQGIVDHLRDAQDCLRSRPQTDMLVSAIGRAIESIAACPTVIKSKADAKALKYVGPATCSLVVEYLEACCESGSSRMPSVARDEGLEERSSDTEQTDGSACAHASSQAIQLQNRMQRSLATVIDSEEDEDLGPGHGRDMPPRAGGNRDRGRGRTNRACRVQGTAESALASPTTARARLGPRTTVDEEPAGSDVEQAASDGTALEARATSRTRKKKPYEPRYRSGAYAVLIALYEASKEGVLYMGKKDLIVAAQPHADEPMEKTAPCNPIDRHAKYYSAWSSTSKLIKEGLLSKASSPAKYSLTMTGLALARKLSEAVPDVSGDTRGMSLRARADGGGRGDTAVPAVPKAAGAEAVTSCAEPEMPSSRTGKLERVGAKRRKRTARERQVLEDIAGMLVEDGFCVDAVRTAVRDYLDTVTALPDDANALRERLRAKLSSTASCTSLTEPAPSSPSKRMKVAPLPMRLAPAAADVVERLVREGHDHAQCFAALERVLGSERVPLLRPPLRKRVLQEMEAMRQAHVSTAPAPSEAVRQPRSSPASASPAFANGRVVLLVDRRDVAGAGAVRARYAAALADAIANSELDAEVRDLPVGDALFVLRSDECERVLDVIIERKALCDLFGSLADGRLDNQTYRMASCGVPTRVVLVEGDLAAAPERDADTAAAHLRRLVVCDGFAVLYTRDPRHTIRTLAATLDALTTRYANPIVANRTRDRPTYHDWARAQAAANELDLRQLFMIQLCAVPGIGESTARALVEAGIGTPHALYRRYRVLDGNTPAQRTLARDLTVAHAAASGFPSARKRGLTTAQSTTLYRLFMLETYDAPAAPAPP